MWPSAVPDPSLSASPVPPPAAPQGPSPLPEAKVSAWWRRITASNEATKPAIDQGKVNVDRYKSKYLTGTPNSDTAAVPSDFWFIEQKKAGTIYRLPDVFLKALQPGKQDAAVVGQAALNAKLGPNGLNILPRLKQVLFDVLCSTGYGAIKVGMEPVQAKPVRMQTGTEPDPSAQPGAVLGLSGAASRPVFGMVPHIVCKRYFAEHVSPGDLGVDPSFVGLDFDDAGFVFVRFREDVKDESMGGSDAADERRLTPLSSGAQAARSKQRIGYEVWYKAARYDDDAYHPDQIRMFTCYEDDQQAAVTPRESPYQRWTMPADPQTGAPAQEVPTWEPGAELSGMIGYPIAPLTLRFISDAWMVPSDCTMARNTADIISKGHTQMIQYRDRSIPQYGYDSTRVDKDTQNKIARNDIGAGIPFNGPGADSTWPIQKGEFGRERFEFHEIGMQLLHKIWGISENRTSEATGGTATEAQIIEAGSQNREAQERDAFMGWYVNKVVAKIWVLLQLFADEQEFVEMLGADVQRLQSIPDEIKQQAQQGGQDPHVLVPWNKDAIQGRMAFSFKANSQLFLDVAQYRKQLMDLYQFFANSPTVDRTEIEREILQAYGFDPSKCVHPPPPKTAEPPKATLSFGGDDMNPLMPQAIIVLDILQKLGIPIDPAVIATAIARAEAMPAPADGGPGATTGAGPDAGHPGAVHQAEPLGKHALDKTGGMQGSGAHAPIAPGGQLL